ncbi:MAG: hypothetical protein AB7P01_16055 [Bacteroidia bacterium]
MAYRRLPKSTSERVSALKHIQMRKAATPPANLPFRQATMDQFDLFYPQYIDKVNNLGKTLAAQSGITSKVVKSKRFAMLLLRDFMDALQNAIRRGTFSASVRALYGLPVEKRYIPKLRSEQDVITWAENIHQGETKRIALGGAPIPFPSLAEVDAATTDFKTNNNQQSNAKNAYDLAQEAVAAQNKIASQLILRCWNEIESEYDVGDKPSLRRKAREWGVVYVPRKGEKTDPNE